MARFALLLLAVCVAAAPVSAIRLLKHSDPAPAATGHPSALQFLLKDRQGGFFEIPPPGYRSSLEKRHQVEDIYQQNQQWYSYSGSNRERQADGGFNEANTYIQPTGDGPTSPYGDSYQDDSAADHTADHPHTEALRFAGSHVARHPLFEEPSSPFPTEYPSSARDSYVNSQVFPPIPTKSTIKKVSSFGSLPPFLTRHPSPGAAASAASSGTTPVGEDRDEFVHHTSSYANDPKQYHVPSAYHEPSSSYNEPASSYEEDDGGLLGNLKKYGGVMAPLLLATSLLFLFPSVQTITSSSTSRRRRRRQLDDSEDPAEETLLLVERLQTIFSSIDEDRLCPSQLFCQLGDVIADSASPARVIKYMKQFYRDGDANMMIMKKAAYAEDPKCHLYDCSHEKDAVNADGSHEHE